MFSLAFVCLLPGLRRYSSADFHRICWKGGTRSMEETDLGGHPGHVTLRLGLWLRLGDIRRLLE